MSGTDTINAIMAAANNHDVDEFAKHWAEDVVVYTPDQPDPLKGRDAVKQNLAEFISGFADLKITVNDIIDDGSRTAMQVTFEGTMTGPMAGPEGEIPPTNKHFVLTGAGFHKFNSQGQITEERRYYDIMGMMMQLGLMPGP